MFYTVLKYQPITTAKLLSGDPTLPFDNNTEILLAVQEYIKKETFLILLIWSLSLSLSLSLLLFCNIIYIIWYVITAIHDFWTL